MDKGININEAPGHPDAIYVADGVKINDPGKMDEGETGALPGNSTDATPPSVTSSDRVRTNARDGTNPAVAKRHAETGKASDHPGRSVPSSESDGVNRGVSGKRLDLPAA